MSFLPKWNRIRYANSSAKTTTIERISLTLHSLALHIITTERISDQLDESKVDIVCSIIYDRSYNTIDEKDTGNFGS